MKCLSTSKDYLKMNDQDGFSFSISCLVLDKFVFYNVLLRWSNTKNIIFLSLMLSDCSFTMLLCELP